MRHTGQMPQPSPSWLLRLADSELAALLRHGDGTVEMRLAAAQLRHPASGDWGNAPGLRLWLGHAQVSGEALPGRLRDGRLWRDGHWLADWPVPGDWHADPARPLRLEWTGPYGDAVVATACTLRVTLGDALIAAWRPWLRC